MISQVAHQPPNWRWREPNQSGQGDNLFIGGAFRLLGNIDDLQLVIPRHVRIANRAHIVDDRRGDRTVPSHVKAQMPGLLKLAAHFLTIDARDVRSLFLWCVPEKNPAVIQFGSFQRVQIQTFAQGSLFRNAFLLRFVTALFRHGSFQSVGMLQNTFIFGIGTFCRSLPV
jgi:hypothetical protein